MRRTSVSIVPAKTGEWSSNDAWHLLCLRNCVSGTLSVLQPRSRLYLMTSKREKEWRRRQLKEKQLVMYGQVTCGQLTKRLNRSLTFSLTQCTSSSFLFYFSLSLFFISTPPASFASSFPFASCFPFIPLTRQVHFTHSLFALSHFIWKLPFKFRISCLSDFHYSRVILLVDLLCDWTIVTFIREDKTQQQNTDTIKSDPWPNRLSLLRDNLSKLYAPHALLVLMML